LYGNTGLMFRLISRQVAGKPESCAFHISMESTAGSRAS